MKQNAVCDCVALAFGGLFVKI